MDPSKLADRLRAIVQTNKARLRPGATNDADDSDAASGFSRTVAEILGGDWYRRDGLSCFVVERRHSPQNAYGRDRLATIAARLADASAEAPLVMGGAAGRSPFFFFDLETTGLSGGAGTCAFLIGCGAFDEDGGFVTRQFMQLGHADERPLLQIVGAELAQAGALVTFNGKSFDVPLIEMRHLFHRLEWTGGDLPHLDVLHPARRFWSDGGAGETSCSLQALENQVLGARRAADVPGSEIPARYFQFIRTGDARPLVAVLEHNRLDLLSLAGLTARLLDLVRRGPGAVQHAREALALGRVYARGGQDGRAREAYQRVMAMGGAASIRIDALRALALLSRRARRYDDAAGHWLDLIGISACPPHFAREASEALAVHHEHRERDLAAAKAFALRCLDARRPAWNEAVQHRLARIEKKMNGGYDRTHPTVRRTLFPS